ncbi:hypothetical protein [Mycobacterium sp. 3519A]|jgi:hypothetical protein|uniref:hypothetical protein n=1 Tax=Mycobacterium sp. 3519A TaxID=2057184 RepID=UPI000C79CB86|nr:hypothetical protein [Mycobacterium sp. 3519A]
MTITIDIPVAAAPSVLARVAARLGARHYDRLVLSGAGTEAGSALAVHVQRLVSRGHREFLAAELRRRGTAVLCDRVMSAPSAKVPAVWDAADLIERVEKRLVGRRSVSPRGTARLRRLLADWNGPLRHRGSGDLCSELRAVLAAL